MLQKQFWQACWWRLVGGRFVAWPQLTYCACCAVLCWGVFPLQIIDAIFEQDPNGATLAFADMMKKQIVMPAHLMDDGSHETTNTGRNLFAVSFTHSWCWLLPCMSVGEGALLCMRCASHLAGGIPSLQGIQSSLHSSSTRC